MTARLIPDIGATVEVLRGGVWVMDWLCQVRIDHGPNPKDAELGVVVWGADKRRFRAGDAWRSEDKNTTQEGS